MKARSALAVLSAAALAACATSPTVFEAVNLRPEGAGRRFSTIVVVPLRSNPETRDIFAAAMVGQLSPWTVRAERGADVLSRTHFEVRDGRLALKTDSDAIRRHLASSGFQAVLVVSRLRAERHSEGGHHWSEDPIGDYFSLPRSTPSARAPQTGDPVLISTDLIDTSTGKVVWSGHSKSIRTEYTVSLAESYAQAVVEELLRSDLIGKR
ncbi:MAG: hypothetical protein FD126_478 [Elusimicrobia bacterium]|nr:MAG: hypothetical protein FD126_478 [Elusimicrobiota bacterium]